MIISITFLFVAERLEEERIFSLRDIHLHAVDLVVKLKAGEIWYHIYYHISLDYLYCGSFMRKKKLHFLQSHNHVVYVCSQQEYPVNLQENFFLLLFFIGVCQLKVIHLNKQ